MTQNEQSENCVKRSIRLAALIGLLVAIVAYFIFGFGGAGSIILGIIAAVVLAMVLMRINCQPSVQQPAETTVATSPAPKPAAAPAPAVTPVATAKPAAADPEPTDTASTENDGDAKPVTLSAPRDGGADDLKLIKGVGPKLEGVCHKLGFYHFDQIANLTDQEVAWVDANLEGFRGRVTRDDWVAQAKILAAGGETEFSAKKKK